ncbi:MAG: TetR/AcrR family transcriptional regulator [Planctomycetota bacterium]|nr:TetR/AcrR family transcriptional regulator [Planctomycetota bacterium]MDI6788030.1 TetR/AcrR family transcriptional regulator [Planctomycetota bacterium]
MKRTKRNKEIRDRRRQEILGIATEMFAIQNYHLVDMERIADKLGVGKGTIYRYFPSKEKLFSAVMEQMMRQLANAIADKTTGITNPLERLKVIIRTHIEFFSKNMHLLEIFIHYRSAYRERARQLYLKYSSRGLKLSEVLVQQCIDRGLIKKISPKAIATLLGDTFEGILFSAFLGSRHKTIIERGKYLEEVFINGLLLPYRKV